MSTAGRCVPLLLVCVSSLTGASAGQDVAADRFEEGKALIEDNCGDAEPRSRQELEKGIAYVEAAVRRGLASAEAYRLLACGYATLGSRFTPVGSERVALGKKHLNALRRASELDPRDIGIKLRIASATDDRDEQLAAYEAVIAIDPKHPLALYASGKLLVRRGETAKGLDRLERAGEVAGPRDAAAWGNEVVRILREHGKEQRANELKASLDAKAKSAR